MVRNAFETIQLAVFAMIIAVAFQTINLSQVCSIKNMSIVVVAFALFIFSGIHPAFIIIGAGFIGALTLP